MSKTPKRPKDTNQLANLIGRIATGEVVETAPVKDAGRAKGGTARAKSLTADERSAVAKKGADARWKKK